MKQYVQHMSGQGEKFKLSDVPLIDERMWRCEFKGATYHNDDYYLPKSEYILCDPPEVWEDVTRECAPNNASIYHADQMRPGEICIHTAQWRHEGVYRVKKMTCQIEGLPRYAFIVERRKP